MEKYLYLFLNLFTISIPLIRSFEPKVGFYKKWDSLFKSIAIVGTLFIIWDVFFTEIGVWGFNPKYLTGLYFFGLPLGEVLFFVCIPFACVFTYVALNYFVKRDYFFGVHQTISKVLSILLLITACFNYDKWYTASTFIILGLYLLLHGWVWKRAYMSRFYFAYLIILIPFFIVNGILTGSGIEGEVVWYNNLENLGIRIVTIPIEDVFYGLLLILLNIDLFEYFERKKASGL